MRDEKEVFFQLKKAHLNLYEAKERTGFDDNEMKREISKIMGEIAEIMQRLNNENHFV